MCFSLRLVFHWGVSVLFLRFFSAPSTALPPTTTATTAAAAAAASAASAPRETAPRFSFLFLLGFTGFYWVLLGLTWFYLVLLGFT